MSTNKTADGLILVIGATGTQGGATARRLLAQGARVRFLTRDPNSPSARALSAAGAEAAIGGTDDPDSLRSALAGVRAVFSMILLFDERASSTFVFEEARRAGVQQIVHSSTMGADRAAELPGWDSGRWGEMVKSNYSAKLHIEKFIRDAGFAQFTILRPGLFMDNYTGAFARAMFPDLPTHGELVTTWHADTKLSYIAADDIGAFAAAAFADPERFNGETIELLGDVLMPAEIAATLSKALNRDIKFIAVTPEQARQRGIPELFALSFEMNNVGSKEGRGPWAPFPIEPLLKYDVPLTKFAAWVDANRAAFVFD